MWFIPSRPCPYVLFFPKLVNFCSCFLNSFNNALNIKLEPCPLISIFGVPRNPASLTKKNSDVVAFFSLIDRRHILLHWKSPNAPPTISWLSYLMSFLSLEKVKYALRGSAAYFYKSWQPLITYVNSFSVRVRSTLWMAQHAVFLLRFSASPTECK